MKASKSYHCIELAQRRLPPRSGLRLIKSLMWSIISIILCSLIVYCKRFSTSGIRALYLAQVGFFLGGEWGQNWAVTFTSIFETLCADSRKKSCISKFLLQKYAVQKNNHLIWSSKSGDIADLKSIFQNFSDDCGNCGAKIFWPSAHICIPIPWVEAEWLFQFWKHAIIAILSNIDPVFEHWVEFLPKFFFCCRFRSGNNPSSLNYGKYLGISPKTHCEEYHRKPEVAGPLRGPASEKGNDPYLID